MSRQVPFSNGVIVSSKFLNDQQQGLTGATFGASLTAHSSDAAKISLVPAGHEVVAPIVLPNGTGAITDDYVVGYKEGSVHSAAADGSAGTRNIWATTNTVAQDATPGIYTISVLPTASTPADAFRRKIGTAQWTGTVLTTGRLNNGVMANSVQTNMFTFQSVFDTTSDIPLTLQGGVAQGSGNGTLLSVGYLITSVYSQKWGLSAKGRVVTSQDLATDDHYRAFVGTDANPVLSLSNMIKMGPGGGTAVDTTIERSAAGVVKVGTTLDVVTIQNSTGSGAVAGAVNVADNLNVTGTISIAGTPLVSTQLSDSAALARLASPTFTGTPSAPTAALDTNSTQLATTAFVITQIASGTAEIAVSKLADGAAYDVLQTNADGTTVAWVSGLTNNHIASGAAIAYSKLNLSGSILNADVNASAGIEISKLAAGTAPAGTYNFPTLQAGGAAVATQTYVKEGYVLTTAITTIGPHTVAGTDNVLLVSYNGPTQLNLPAAPAAGKVYTVVDSGGFCSATNTITVDCSGAEVIAGGANYVLMSPYESVTFVSLGVGIGWAVI